MSECAQLSELIAFKANWHNVILITMKGWTKDKHTGV